MNIEKQEVLKILKDNKIMCVISWTSRNSILLIGKIFWKLEIQAKEIQEEMKTRESWPHSRWLSKKNKKITIKPRECLELEDLETTAY